MSQAKVWLLLLFHSKVIAISLFSILFISLAIRNSSSLCCGKNRLF